MRYSVAFMIYTMYAYLVHYLSTPTLKHAHAIQNYNVPLICETHLPIKCEPSYATEHQIKINTVHLPGSVQTWLGYLIQSQNFKEYIRCPDVSVHSPPICDMYACRYVITCAHILCTVCTGICMCTFVCVAKVYLRCLLMLSIK